MKKIIGTRASGKTVELCKRSSRNNIPIVVMSETSKRYLYDIANRLGITIPDPINVKELKLSNKPIGTVYIDEAEHVLDYIFQKHYGVSVSGFTLTFLNSDTFKFGEFPYDN